MPVGNGQPVPPRVSRAGALARQAGFAVKWLVLGVAAVALLVISAPWLLPERQQLSLQTLESRYATPASRFADLDGLRLHYTDEGEGPVVVLLHASFMDLRSWDSLSNYLKPGYRVIRLDLLASGLTGHEPNDRYSFDRNLELVDQLTQRLGIREFALLGTSSGGIVAFNFAARYPERVTRLILVNSAGMPRNAKTNPNRGQGNPLMSWLSRRYQTRGMVRDNLATNFVEPHEPPQWLVDRSYDMRLRKGLQREGALLLRNFSTGDPQAVLSGVRAPTLIIWGLENQTVFHLEADVFRAWLTGAPSLVKKYPGVGHYLYLEAPEQFEKDVGDFLAGRMDQQLTTCQRVP